MSANSVSIWRASIVVFLAAVQVEGYHAVRSARLPKRMIGHPKMIDISALSVDEVSNTIGSFVGTLTAEASALSAALEEFRANTPPLDLATLADKTEQAVSQISSTALAPLVDLVQPVIGQARATLAPMTSTPVFAELTLKGVALQLAAIAAVSLGSAVSRADAKGEAPYAPGKATYDPKAAETFYSQRPLVVAKRVISLARLTTAFTAGVLFDWLVLGKLMKDTEYRALQKAEPRRAKEALALCEQLGPTFIKLGQALSIRTDLIPEAYALELRQLQDAVPPFPSQEAYKVLQRQLGIKDVRDTFETLSARPVASASIGQVYKGTLKGNTSKTVAVKVQRPGILSEIALDLYVLRLITPFQTAFTNLVNGVSTAPEDIEVALQLVDEWGRGFVAETDYRLEAKNTIDFQRAMAARGLDAVCAPTVVEELARDTVLVTEWVDGTRLDRDASADVPRLCGVAINAYLTMLLDTGVLHCDPHPGNLLRTTDGRLCVLDWGMTLEVPNELQYSLLEFIAHLNVEDYDAIPQDFINLGFSPPDVTPERLKASGITEGLAFAFRQLSAGGGPKKIAERVESQLKERYGAELSGAELEKKAQEEFLKAMEAQLASEGVDVKGVTNVMEEMSRRNRELFSLPPYVLYVARAFSTLEGIGLSIDEDYAIVQECYPYLARRLFIDRSPRAEAALRAMLGLPAKRAPGLGLPLDVKGVVVPTRDRSPSRGLPVLGATTTTTPLTGRGLSPAKLIEMSEGFASYTAATAEVDRDGVGQTKAARELANLLLAPEGSTLQDILVDELVVGLDAATRQALRSLLITAPSSVVGQFGLKPPATLTTLLAPTAEDELVLGTARELSNLLGPRVRSQLNTSAVPAPRQIADTVTDLVGTLLNDEAARSDATRQLEGLSLLSRRIGAGLLRRAALRATNAAELPQAARDVLTRVPTAMANSIEPPAAPAMAALPKGNAQ